MKEEEEERGQWEFGKRRRTAPLPSDCRATTEWEDEQASGCVHRDSTT